MFLIGTPEDRAQALMDAINARGISGHYEDMEEKDLKVFIARFWGVVERAMTGGEDQEVVDILLADYDELFAYYASISPEFREVVKRGIHQIPGPKTKERTSYYRRLAGVA